MRTKKDTSPESIVREIKRKTRRKFSAEEKICIILEGLRGEESIADHCRKEGIHPTQYYKWSKAFLEAGKRKLTIRFIENLGFKSFKVDQVYPNLNKLENNHYFNTFINIYNQKLKELPRLNGNSYLINKQMNSCLYGKVAVAINGDIIPCQTAKYYPVGNINSITLSESLKKGLLDKYWYLTKDKLDRCKDCERRYACMDCTVLPYHQILS